MRTKLFVIALGFLLLAPLASTAQVATYLFDAPCTTTCTNPGPDCPGVGNQNATSFDSFVLSAASTFTVSPALNLGTANCATPTFSTSMNGFAAGNPANPSRARWASGWTTGMLANASHYFTCTLTVATFATVGISQITFDETRSATGPRMCQVMVSTDGGMSFTPLWQGMIPDNTSWRSRSITSGTALTAMPVFSNTLIIRFQGFASEAATGSWRIDNARFYATITNLPIELLSFTGAAEGDSVRLRWSTATETDNDHFTIEKSLDGTSWDELGTQPGAGTSLYRIDYVMFDTRPHPGWNYYQLRQTDVDGRSETFGPIAVHWLVDDGLTRIVDAFGREVQSWSETHNLTDLPRGWYIVESKYRPPRTIVIP